MEDINIDNIIDGVADQAGRRSSGRPNTGLTDLHYKDYNDSRRQLRQIKQPDNFNSDLVEAVAGEVVNIDNIDQFKELYKTTCYAVLDQFKEDNPELVNKPPFTWYKRVLLLIKENTPPVTYKELDKLSAVWEVLTDFMDYIGLYITFETFSNLLKVYDYQLKKMEDVNPEYAAFRQKIKQDRDNALINELQYNPYTQGNKIFIAKTHGIIEKQQPKQIEVTHNLRNYDNINRYRLEDQQKNN